ncbi:MFS transporter [Nocardia terpenica]|uniref:MFS transporter n=1 Tax=Nocardia terpenica TaxID=455432 RepID=UPI0018947E41|nr:MFS transporter [Nocardia terpenica]MBF6066350.1 MFS transporter [Nocardia terpenica]MBF6108977.1 MFS transporter [Nocardia terpenica]MBF6116597.1 MFS transporter [Nocardia terpenica]MBF6121820.1 MFS transporter [Nocardia terpenica]MBF6155635.1 MFS transporter [Nocardia terpenica]
MQYPVTRGAFGLPILVLSGLQLMVILDGSVVILALPRLQEQMGLSSSGSAWTVTAYGLTFAGLMLLGGRLGDCFGRKRMLIIGVSLFTLASLLCGLAQDEGMLIAARAIQGAGAAIAAPSAMALVASTYAPGPARNQAIAIFGSMAGVGSVGGLVIGGALAQYDWRWIFWINVPIGALILLGAVYKLRDTTHHRLTLDVRGSVLGTLACVSIVFGATEGPEMGWGSPVIVSALVVGVLLLVAFIFAERTVDNPVLPLSLFDHRDRVAAFIALLLGSGVLGAMTYFVAQFLQNVVGYSPLVAGLASIPFTVGAGIGTAIASKAVMVVRPRWLLAVAAVCLSTAGIYGSTLDGSVHYPTTLLPLLLVAGVGVGLVIVVTPLCLLVGVPVSEVGPLSAIGQMIFNLGTPIAVGVLSPVAASRTLALGGRTGRAADMTPAQISALGSGYTLVLFVCGIGAIVVGLIALTLRYTTRDLAQAQHAQEESQQV